jgi:hypothetical protein
MLSNLPIEQGIIYKFLRSVACPFIFVFGVIFGSLSVVFLQLNINLNPLFLFSVCFAALFCLPFLLFDKLAITAKGSERRLGENQKVKLACVLIIDSILAAISAVSIGAVTAQIGPVASGPTLALVCSMGLVATVFICLFSVTFYFSESIDKKLE